MQDSTKTIIRAALEADATLSAGERAAWQSAMANGIAAAQPTQDPPRLYRPAEIAKALGVSKDYVRLMARNGALRRVRLGGSGPMRYLFPELRPDKKEAEAI